MKPSEWASIITAVLALFLPLILGRLRAAKRERTEQHGSVMAAIEDIRSEFQDAKIIVNGHGILITRVREDVDGLLERERWDGVERRLYPRGPADLK